MSDPLWGVQAATATTGATASAGSDAAHAADNLGSMGKDTFMALLVAQLKYQNPMQPTDSMQFVQQLAMFSMIEQLQAIREDLDSMKTAPAGSPDTGTSAGTTGTSGPADGQGGSQ